MRQIIPISNVPTRQPADLVSRLQLPRLYYDKVKMLYRGLEKGGGWTSLNEKAARESLTTAGINSPDIAMRFGSLPEVMVRIRYENGVDYAGPLSGYRKGYCEIDNRKILVTRSFHLIKPERRPWPILKKYLLGLLGKLQLLHLLFWLKVAYEALTEGIRRPGQALVLAGPANSGKSFLQHHVITPALGGRSCRCYRYLSGHTDFNGDLFEAEHLIIDDDVPSANYQNRLALANSIKSIVAGELQSCHYKYRDAFTVGPFWRLSISVNDSPESLLVLPPIDESLEDKLMIFKAQKCPMPMPTETMVEREAFRKTIYAELPGLLDLITRYPIPPDSDWASRRFAVAHYHHPEIIQAVHELSAEERLLTLIDTVLFVRHLPLQLSEPSDLQPWEGTAAELEQKLTESQTMGREARKLLDWNNACGTYLGRLAKRHPDRIEYRRTTGGKRLWKIMPACPVQ